MSSERGNVSRSRPQKHQNSNVFKNNLHDTSHTIKKINNTEISNVCLHCKGVLEWKIKYKKYKPLKAPSNCVKCHMKCVKQAYHTLCGPCSISSGVCGKCGVKISEELSASSQDMSFLNAPETKLMIKELSERKRRTLNRFIEKVTTLPNAKRDILKKLEELRLNDSKLCDLDFDDDDDDDDDDDSDDDSDDGENVDDN